MTARRGVWLWTFVAGLSRIAAAASGALDPTFGTNGIVTLESGSWGERLYPWGATRTLDPANPDAVVVVAVTPGAGGAEVVSAVVAPSGALLSATSLGFTDVYLTCVVADPTDAAHRLYAAGYRYVEGGTPSSSFAVVRLTPLGDAVDPAWAGGTPVVTDIPGTTSAEAALLAVQPDGKLLVAGRADAGGSAVALARYDVDGALDPAFGAGGTTVLPDGSVSALTVQDDGRIVLGGWFRDGTIGGFGVLRLLADGSPDASFGAAVGAPGIATTIFSRRYTQGHAVGVQVLADGRIVAVGSDWDPYRARGAFVAARYLPDGTLDRTFNGRKGRIRKRVGKSNVAGAVAFQGDGRILIAGTARRAHPEYHSDVALLRLTADGKPDRTYGRGGRVQTPVVPDWQGFGVREVILDSLGRATVVGGSGDGTGKATILARFEA